MKSISILFGVGFICLMLAAIMGALNAFRAVDVTEPHNVTLTGSDNTTASFVLANDVLDNNKVNITVYSPNVGDAPVAYGYVSATHLLTVNGLLPDTSRQLSVVYKVSRLDGFVDLMVRFVPAFLVIGLIFIIIGAAVAIFQGRG